MVEQLPDAELAKLVEKLRELYSKNTSESRPDTLAMAQIESIYALKNSSNRLEKPTYILIFFTIILAILTVVLLMK